MVARVGDPFGNVATSDPGWLTMEPDVARSGNLACVLARSSPARVRDHAPAGAAVVRSFLARRQDRWPSMYGYSEPAGSIASRRNS
jgi:hypothetical protein